MSYWGYYIPPRAWLVKQPRNDGKQSGHLTDEAFDVSQISDLVYEDTLACGLKVRGYCDGLFLFDFSGADGFSAEPSMEQIDSFEKTAQLRLERTEVLNAHVVFLRKALSEKQRWGMEYQSVSPHDLLSHHSDEDTNKAVGFRSDRDVDLHMARYATAYVPWYPKTFDRRIQGRMLVIGSCTIEQSFQDLSKLLLMDDRTPLRLTSLFNFAMVSLQDHDYPRSLITSWAIIERLLDREWSAYMAGRRKEIIDGVELAFINTERLKKLESRDYTASVKTEILSLLGALPFDTYKGMENVRKVRNGWMHELKLVKMADALDGIKVAAKLFKSAYDMELPDGLSLSL
jgi:hypothetical protein